MDLLIFGFVTAWPLFMVTAMLLTGDLDPPQRVEEWLEDRWWEKEERRKLAAERVPAPSDYTTGAIVTEEAWALGSVEIELTAGRWWRFGLGGDPTMLVAEQSDFVFGAHWCIYEIEGLEPFLIAAIPRSEVRTIQDLLGPTVQPSDPYRPRGEAVCYPWKPVPVYVTRTLEDTAAWVGRQGIGAWM